MPFIPKSEGKNISMGNLAQPFFGQHEEKLKTEMKAAASHMFDETGRSLDELMESFDYHRTLQPPKRGGKPKLGFKGPPPVIRSPEPTMGPYDPSLCGCSGLGQGKGNYCHDEIGGAADHHKTPWPWVEMDEPAASTVPPSRAGSQVSLRSKLPPSRGSLLMPSRGQTSCSRAASAAARSSKSRRSSGSRALSAASSVLLKHEIEEAVRKEVSRLTTPLIA
eukprot:TRINITY_DN75794_c0_g1_i1.p1 TRINITY_DN75794_c0_g1~~TRINITY_DN75794_c0_g1_i1.p1  ORF type:complete len:221 (+),score=42.66 TRINITY_DN75794_c0_g1_i1:28-690(+)